jgi:PhnB protein
MAKLNPYVRIDNGKCREAMEFYKDCLGGRIEIMTMGESPMAKDMPAEKHGYIMHAELSNGQGITLYGSDAMRDKVVTGDNVGLALDCASQEEIETIFAKLSKGGEVFMPLEEAFWGGVFGMVTDRYGVEWMLNYQKKPMKK